jgi:DNA-binding NarL/FixJ family response regulator
MSGCVILVERDTLVREGLSALLHAWAFDVASGTDPREAMARAAGTVAPRLGIIAAPDGDAVRDARWIASLRFCDRDLPIVLTADDFIDAIWLPNCVHVPWPANPASLRHAIAVIVGYERRFLGVE